MLGKRFGKLVVQEKLRRHPTIKRDGYYRCLCDCGATCEARATALRKGQKKSCGCLLAVAITSPWVGKKVGQLLVLERLPDRKYRCLCDCGAEIVSTSMWRRAKTEDANCRGPAHRAPVPQKKVVVASPPVKAHYLYMIWAGMKTRCYNKKNKDYVYYGARGIGVCDEWRRDFKVFREYIRFIGDRPSPEYSIDRKDNDRGYEPGNVRWATAQTQTENRRRGSS